MAALLIHEHSIVFMSSSLPAWSSVHTKVSLPLPEVPGLRHLQQRRFGPQSPMRHLQGAARLCGATNQTRGKNDANQKEFIQWKCLEMAGNPWTADFVKKASECLLRQENMEIHGDMDYSKPKSRAGRVIIKSYSLLETFQPGFQDISSKCRGCKTCKTSVVLKPCRAAAELLPRLHGTSACFFWSCFLKRGCLKSGRSLASPKAKENQVPQRSTKHWAGSDSSLCCPGPVLATSLLSV